MLSTREMFCQKFENILCKIFLSLLSKAPIESKMDYFLAQRATNYNQEVPEGPQLVPIPRPAVQSLTAHDERHNF